MPLANPPYGFERVLPLYKRWANGSVKVGYAVG
jgi:hypothetical protein